MFCYTAACVLTLGIYTPVSDHATQAAGKELNLMPSKEHVYA